MPTNDHKHYVNPLVSSKVKSGPSHGPQVFLFYDIESRLEENHVHTPICLIVFRVNLVFSLPSDACVDIIGL